MAFYLRFPPSTFRRGNGRRGPNINRNMARSHYVWQEQRGRAAILTQGQYI